MSERVTLASAALALVVACAGRPAVTANPPPVPEIDRIDVIAHVIVPTDGAPRHQRLSGISGLAYDRWRHEWIAVSDDRQAPRWYVTRFAADRDRLVLTSDPPVTAALPAGGARALDFEAVVILPDGDLLIASEGGRDGERRYPSSIMRFRRDGHYLADVRVPERFLPSTGEADRGLRDNHGFESLGLSPDGSRLWAIAEGPLLQDDEPATGRRGARIRLIEFVRHGGSFAAARELVYPIDRVPIAANLGDSAVVVDQGVSEMTVLPDGTLLSMERAFVRDNARRRSWNVVRLFRLDLDGADDVSGTASLRQATGVRAIRKELVADLSALTSALPPALADLENFEAMAPAPSPAGAVSIVMMSDDNFSASQVTAAVLLRYKP
ncbi:MAG: esterase-like activity of phytase family protein [Vicinamibacterales bacterium]